MPTKKQELVVEITAQADQAQRAISALAKSAKPLEDGVDVPVKLTGADKAAGQLEDAAKAARDVDQAVAGIDAGGVKSIGGPAAAAAADFDKIAENAEQAAKAVADVGKGAGRGLDEVSSAAGQTTEQMTTTTRAADGTKNAFANLVGNTAQDLSGLGGAFSSIGVAIGQVAEYTADAANEGGGLTAALQGAASAAGPMLALAAAGFVVQKVLGDMQKRSQEAREANDAYLASLNKSVPLLEDWTSALDEGFKQGTLDRAGDWNTVMADTLKTMGKLDTATSALGRLGLEADDLGEAIGRADESWQSWAKSLIPGLGLSNQAAQRLALIIDHARDLGDLQSQIGARGKGTFGDMVTPEQLARVASFATGVSDIREIVRSLNTESKARDFNDQARAFADYLEVVDQGRAAGKTEQQVALDVADAYGRQKRQRDENARAAEEGARAVAEAGSIQEQVARQVEQAQTRVTKAIDDTVKAQDNWLLHEVDYQSGVDDFTESLVNLADQLAEQRKAGDEGAASFEGNTKAALDNRDALGDVYSKAVDVIQSMKDAGFSVDGARQAQDNMAQSAYELAIRMGLPVAKAEEIRDKIRQIPPSVSSEVAITEQGYAEVKAKKDTLDKDMESTLYIYGVLDRSVLNAINSLPPGSIPSSRGAAPASSAVVPATSTLTAPPPPAGVAVMPAAAPAGRATLAVPVTVNVSAGVVADTFQLQRVVERAVRSGARLGGRRP